MTLFISSFFTLKMQTHSYLLNNFDRVNNWFTAKKSAFKIFARNFSAKTQQGALLLRAKAVVLNFKRKLHVADCDISKKVNKLQFKIVFAFCMLYRVKMLPLTAFIILVNWHKWKTIWKMSCLWRVDVRVPVQHQSVIDKAHTNQSE